MTDGSRATEEEGKQAISPAAVLVGSPVSSPAEKPPGELPVFTTTSVRHARNHGDILWW